MKLVDSNAIGPVYVDFDLILRKEVINLPQAPLPNTVRARPVTTTIIQEEGLLSIIVAKQAGSGCAIAIRDQWRCIDSNCSNHLYTC